MIKRKGRNMKGRNMKLKNIKSRNMESKLKNFNEFILEEEGSIPFWKPLNARSNSGMLFSKFPFQISPYPIDRKRRA